MELIECQEKNLWNSWFLKQKQDEFLQSWEWGEFQNKVGNKPIRLRIMEKGEIAGQIQGFEYKLFLRIKFIYIPKLSITNYQLPITALFDYFKKRGFMFSRIEPVKEIGKLENYKITEVENRQPRNTFILDARLDEDGLLEKMHAKTRYNIKLAQKNGVEIKQEKNAGIFWGLNEERSTRDKFKSHDRRYYEKMLEAENCYQLNAYYNGEAAASIILFHFGDTMTYLHGASGSKHRNLMAPYLLQWKGILLAKKMGASYYDLGGVSKLTISNEQPTINKKITCFNGFCWDVAHKWTGITRFKVGFGGASKEYPQAVEVVFKPILYGLFNLVKKVRNLY